MHTQRKWHRRAREFRPRLTTLIRNINLARYRNLLPGAQADKKKQRYRPESMTKALVARQLNNWPYRRLGEELRKSAALAKACGFVPGRIPHYSYFCRFFKALDPEVLKEVCVQLLRSLARLIPIRCDVLAVDSSPFVAYANSFSKAGDLDAGTGKSSCKGWFYGYKLHVAADAGTELTVAMEVTPGNTYDGHHLLAVLRKAQSNLPRKFQAVLGDKGYDAGYVHLGIVKEFGAFPIIPLRGDSDPIEYRQLTLDECFGGLRSFRRSVPVSEDGILGAQLRKHPLLPRDSTLYRTLERQRPAVERFFSRFKAFFCPPRLRVRGLRSAEIWFLLGWFSQLSSALYLTRRGHPELIRSFPYRY